MLYREGISLGGKTLRHWAINAGERRGYICWYNTIIIIQITLGQVFNVNSDSFATRSDN